MNKLSLLISCICLLHVISCSKSVNADINSSDPDERRLGVLAVTSSDKETVKRLIGFLDDEDDLVRSAAVANLADIGSPAFLEHLKGKLNDQSPRVRESACRALGKIRNESGIADLISVAKGDMDGSVRREAIKALATYRENKDIISPLIDAVGDNEPSVSIAAHNALQSITGVKDVARQKGFWEEWHKKQASGSNQ